MTESISKREKNIPKHKRHTCLPVFNFTSRGQPGACSLCHKGWQALGRARSNGGQIPLACTNGAHREQQRPRQANRMWGSSSPASVLDGIHPRVLRECTQLLTETLSVISQQSWLTQEVTVDWKSLNVIFICKKGKEEDTRNYRPVSHERSQSRSPWVALHSMCRIGSSLQERLAWPTQSPMTRGSLSRRGKGCLCIPGF